MSYYRHYPYFCLLRLSSLNRSTAGWQLTVTAKHAEEVKIWEVILKDRPIKNPLLHLPKQSCH